MIPSLKEKFRKIGARVDVAFAGATRVRGFTRIQNPPASLDVLNDSRGEYFQIRIREDISSQLDISVLEIQPKDKHLVLLAKQVDNQGNVITKDHFLCGKDERHLFVASVGKVSTVAAAKESLKPKEILARETGLTTEKRNRRKTRVFRRQGEWFFIPEEIVPDPSLIRKDEPLARNTSSKAHIAEYAYRVGGQPVKVCREYPSGLTHSEYMTLITDNPNAKFLNWRDMKRNASVYVKGKIRHADHATVTLETWHRVLMNTETFSPTAAVTVEFLD
ncbi:MAG TPA: hypothetical protein PKZ32_17410 [Candidatus Melainabacteria bacterium]|nr:hypothetical protein [Candidatus Melainabacteria bacterium]